MSTLQGWLLSLLVLALTASPLMAGNNETKAANDTTANTTTTEGSPTAGTPAPSPSPNPSPNLGASAAAGDSNVTALLGVLVMKGVLAPNEANSIRNAAPSAQFQALVDALSQKGLVSPQDLLAISAAKPAAVAVPVNMAMATQAATPSAAPAPEKKPEGPTVIPAVAPLRVLPLDPPVKDGLLPSFKTGAVRVTPYGFIKVTAVHDTSSPNGDDFPFPGIFLNSTNVFSTGPTKDPSFHLKARASRFGANFEWPDLSKKLTLTGKVEGDLEGGFTEVDNADVSSIRNPTPRLRLAYARLDYAASEDTDVFFEAGQNWTLFGSSALPNILETTFLGAYSGDVWERAPQMRFGFVQKLGGSDRKFKISPEFAIMMPSTGQIYKLNGTLGGFEAQIGEGERQGADSGRPELEGRVVLQFQLDKAPGVAPAQLIWSGYEARRTAITPNSALTADMLKTFPAGFTNGSNLFGNQLAVQLPTRWITVVASAYRGGDMRFMLAGQLNTFFTNTTGLFNVQTVQTQDNVGVAGAQQVGCTLAYDPEATTCTTAGGKWQIASQHPIGSFGGFINLGLPLSGYFNADPKGRNAGWQLYLHAGKDQVVHHDIQHALGIGCTSADGLTACNGGIPLSQSRLLAATVYYKLNAWTTFAFEQSQYQTTLTPEVGPLYQIAGHASNKWKDNRTEFGPIFTF